MNFLVTQKNISPSILHYNLKSIFLNNNFFNEDYFKAIKFFKLQFKKEFFFDYTKFINDNDYIYIFLYKLYYYYQFIEFLLNLDFSCTLKVEDFDKKILQVKKKKKKDFLLIFNISINTCFKFFQSLFFISFSLNNLYNLFKYNYSLKLKYCFKENKLFLNLINFHIFFSFLIPQKMNLKFTSVTLITTTYSKKLLIFLYFFLKFNFINNKLPINSKVILNLNQLLKKYYNFLKTYA